jgi:predicted DNA-binding WGR domain protein
MVILHRVEPKKLVYRWYIVQIQPTLLDQLAVVCSWGSLRSNYSRQRAIPAESREKAEELAATIVERKVGKGYSKVNMQYPQY